MLCTSMPSTLVDPFQRADKNPSLHFLHSVLLSLHRRFCRCRVRAVDQAADGKDDRAVVKARLWVQQWAVDIIGQRLLDQKLGCALCLAAGITDGKDDGRQRMYWFT
jgi:hypothetical protein